MRLKDVIPNPDALVTRDYWRAANSVANEGERQPSPEKAATEATTAKLRNQITRNAPEINWDYAVIQRLNPQDLTTRLVPFDLGKLVLQGDEQNNLALEPGDVIVTDPITFPDPTLNGIFPGMDNAKWYTIIGSWR